MNRLRELREQKNLTLNDVSLALEIPYQTYRNYEIEKRQPKDQETWKNLADYYGVSVPYIMGISDSPVEIDTELKKELLEEISSKINDSKGQISGLLDPLIEILSNSSIEKIEENTNIIISLLANAQLITSIYNHGIINSDEIKKLTKLFSSIKLDISESVSKDTLYGQKLDLDKHNERISDISKTLNELYSSNLEEKNFNVKEI